MRLLKRIGEVLTANLNELVEQCENPERMLKQAIRELEANVGLSLDAAARSIAHQTLLSRRFDQEQREIDACHKAAEKAVRHEDDRAAREALHIKAEHERSIAELS